MHPDRLRYLAEREAPRRAVLRCEQATTGSTLHLACGHAKDIAPHFDASRETDARCIPCGVDVVKAASRYASEFI
jgi:hypothetical protein